MSAQPAGPNATPEFTANDLFMAGAVVCIWGMNFVVMKFGLHEFTPFQLGAARFAMASLPLMLFVKRPALPWRLVVGYGLLQGVGQFGFLFTALSVGMTASLASVIMQTQVFFTAMLGVMFLGERVRRSQRFGMGLAMSGLGCFAIHFIATNSINPQAIPLNVVGNATPVAVVTGVTALGLLLNLCAAASWAAANVVARQAQTANPRYDALGFVVWTSVVPVAPLALMSLLTDSPASHANWLKASWQGWSSVAYLAFVATVLAYAMWTQLLKRHAASRVAPFGLAVPVVGLTAGMLLLGERLSAWQWAGSGCIVAALFVTLLGPRWRRATASGT